LTRGNLRPARFQGALPWLQSLTKKRPGRPLDKDSARRAADLAPHCTVIFEHFLDTFSSRPMAIQGCPRHGRDGDAATLRRVLLEGIHLSDRPVRYGMIALDAAPTVVRLRGAPIIFHSPEETVEYAQLHDVQRWMVYGDPEGWWPLYTQDGPVNPPPEPKARVDISLHR